MHGDTRQTTMQQMQQMQPMGFPGAPLEPQTTVSPAAAIKFAFSDRDWTTTLLLSTVFMFIPIAGPIALAGYHCEVMQRLVRRDPRPLPKLDFADFTHYLGRGLVPFAVSLLVMLPIAMLFSVLGVLASFGISGVFAFGLHPAVGIGMLVGVGGLAIIAGLALAVVVNAAQTRAELTEDFGQSLSFGKLMSYSGATWAVVMVKVFVYGFLGALVGIAGMLILCVGVYPASIVVQLGQLHLRWQIYERYRALGGEEIPAKAPTPLPSQVQPQYGIG